MAGSVNKVILVGNVGADPEIRVTQAGKKIANFRMAMSESWKDRASGERKEKTEWVSVCVFNEHLVPVVEQYVKKGGKVYVEGQLATRKYEKDGIERYTTEVVLQAFNGQLVLLGSPGDKGKAEEPAPAPAKASAPPSKPTAAPGKTLISDDIPFNPQTL
jgi:single-strand DNA-binding protein